jgi:hypothetical protein
LRRSKGDKSGKLFSLSLHPFHFTFFIIFILKKGNKMKTLKSFLITSFVLLFFTLLFTQSCSDNSIPVNQSVNKSQEADRLCQTCWLIIYAYFEGEPVPKADVVVKFNNEPYLWGETDDNGICSFYTENLGLPGSPPPWYVWAENQHELGGGEWFTWDGYSYKYVAVECHAWEE